MAASWKDWQEIIDTDNLENYEVWLRREWLDLAQKNLDIRCSLAAIDRLGSDVFLEKLFGHFVNIVLLGAEEQMHFSQLYFTVPNE